MSEDTPEAGGLERHRINPNENDDVRQWAARFGVPAERLREAVLVVGNHADEVQRYLRDGTRR